MFFTTKSYNYFEIFIEVRFVNNSF